MDSYLAISAPMIICWKNVTNLIMLKAAHDKAKNIVFYVVKYSPYRNIFCTIMGILWKIILYVKFFVTPTIFWKLI
jgi:hypothetical protein